MPLNLFLFGCAVVVGRRGGGRSKREKEGKGEGIMGIIVIVRV